MSPFLPNSNQATAPPVVRELRPLPDAVDVFQRLKHLPYALFLDSALRNSVLGRYSFVAADPFDFVQVCLQDGDSPRLQDGARFQHIVAFRTCVGSRRTSRR